MKQLWWKLPGIALVLFSIIYGLIMPVPALVVLNETIRNVFYHVPMWFAMIALLTGSAGFSIAYLKKPTVRKDVFAEQLTVTAVFLGLLGLLTGMIWARFTWGTFWTNDPKLNGVAIGMLIYLAYLILRAAIEEPEKKARVSAVFSIFAYPMFIVLVGILPRMSDSLHPGNGGNPGFNTYDIDASIAPVFYSAVIGWILTGLWVATLRSRLKKLELDHDDAE